MKDSKDGSGSSLQIEDERYQLINECLKNEDSLEVSDISDDFYSLAINYCSEVEVNPKLRQLILDSKKPQWAYYYCKKVDNDEQMVRVIAEHSDLKADSLDYLNAYTRLYGENKLIKKKILDRKSGEDALWWSERFGACDKMKQVIIDYGNAEQAYSYYANIERDDALTTVKGFKAYAQKYPTYYEVRVPILPIKGQKTALAVISKLARELNRKACKYLNKEFQ